MQDKYFFKNKSFLVLLLFCFNTLAQEIDLVELNNYILKEVNLLRVKNKVKPLKNNDLLDIAALDHAKYLSKKQKLTHFQKWNKEKRNPKNRVDFFDLPFKLVGENIQVVSLLTLNRAFENERKITDFNVFLAKALVENWRKSKPHFLNMISESYTYTWTAIDMDKNQNIYACQLFSGEIYKPKLKEKTREELGYRSYNEKKIGDLKIRGLITIEKDSLIYFTPYSHQIGPLKGLFKRNWGVAADIVLKSQFPCDSNNFFNPLIGVSGIPLDPVYKKHFKKFHNWEKCFRKLYLGKIPAGIDEPFQINLTLIKNKRPVHNVVFHNFSYNLNLSLDMFSLESAVPTMKKQLIDTCFNYRINFDKSSAEILIKDDIKSFWKQIEALYKEIDSVELIAYSSIEGNELINKELRKKRLERANSLIRELDSSSFKIELMDYENFNDFRSFLTDTEFSHWKNFSNNELIHSVNNSEDEFISEALRKSRYLEIKIYAKIEEVFQPTLNDLLVDYNNFIASKNYKAAKELIQSIYLQSDEGFKEFCNELKSKISIEKNSLDLIFEIEKHCFVSEWVIDEYNHELVEKFKSVLQEIVEINPKHKPAKSALYILDFYLLETGDRNVKDAEAMYSAVKKEKSIDPKIKSRLLLNIVSLHDYLVWVNNLKKNYLIKPELKKELSKADLNTSELFDVSGYFFAHGYDDIAFEIIKSKYLESDNNFELAYFLKLVTLGDLKINQKQKIRYVTDLAQTMKEDFCKLFTEYGVNFQILMDQEIKDLYCKFCN